MAMFASKGYESRLLRAKATGWATKVSYGQVADLLEQVSGEKLLSDQRIQAIVLEEARQIAAKQSELIAAHRHMPPIEVESGLDIYEAGAQEMLWMEDGIGVSKQKPTRDKSLKTTRERVITDVILMQRPDKDFECMVAAGGIDLEALAKAQLYSHYSKSKGKLPIVCISDGARNIKNRLHRLFGEGVTHFIDWYHLEEKVWQLMSMIAVNKEQKKQYSLAIIACLWQGQSKQALQLLQQIPVRNKEKQEELQGYLQKHQGQLINYEKRKQAGKTIGSGRVEKAVDMLVGQRQKRKAMSWSEKGSNALALIKAQQLNESL
jgi:hypothetical protein